MNKQKLKPLDNHWNTATPVNEIIIKEYDAVSDPYCPYTRTKQFKQHFHKQLKLEKLTTKQQVSKTLSYDLNTGLNTSLTDLNPSNHRPNSAPDNQIQPLQHSFYSQKTITISAEPSGNVIESETELEVLKTILTREGYLTRLLKIVKKIEKKFKPEIADILDMIRISSVNVIEAIVAWRAVKVCHLLVVVFVQLLLLFSHFSFL